MNPTHLIDQAKAHFERKEFDEALKCLNAYILAEPRAGVGHYNRGVIFRKQGKFDKALADFETAIRVAPRSPDAYLGRGDVYRDQKRYAQAVTDYTKALSLDPRRRNIYGLRGEALFHLKKYEAALADFNKGLQLDHEEPLFYHLRGMTYLALKLHEKALDDLNIAIRISPKDPRFYHGRALVYRPLLEYGKAMDDLNRAVDLATTSDARHEFYLRRAELNLLRGHPLRSLADHLRCEQCRPGHRAGCYFRPLRDWSKRNLKLIGTCVKGILGYLVYKPFLCLYDRFLLFPMLSLGLDTNKFTSLNYKGLAVTFIVDNEGHAGVDQEFYQRAADCFVDACDAPDAPKVMKEARDRVRKMLILNLDPSESHHHRLMQRNSQGHRVLLFGKLLKTNDLTACTQFFAEEVVWFFYSRCDYYSIRFWLFTAEELKPRAWVSYRQQKPEIDAYLERFCKAKLAEYAKSPEKPRAWPYYGVKA